MEFDKTFIYILIIGVLYALVMLGVTIWGYSNIDSICNNDKDIRRSLQALAIANIVYLTGIMTFGLLCKSSCERTGELTTPGWFYRLTIILGLFNIITSAYMVSIFKKEKYSTGFSNVIVNLGIAHLAAIIFSIAMLYREWSANRVRDTGLQEVKKLRREGRLDTEEVSLQLKYDMAQQAKEDANAKVTSLKEQLKNERDAYLEAIREKTQADNNRVYETDNEQYQNIVNTYNEAVEKRKNLESSLKSAAISREKAAKEESNYLKKLNEVLRKANKAEKKAENAQVLPAGKANGSVGTGVASVYVERSLADEQGNGSEA
jgi:hypothetical protein